MARLNERNDWFDLQFDEEMETFKGMDEPAVNRWCFYDLKKRGAIE